MAVQSGRGSPWRALLLRGFDIAGELAETVARKISAANDPRQRLLRRRRRALRWGLIFVAGCVFWAVTTAVLAAWGWFALLLEITGGVAVAQAMIATLLLIRYGWLKSEPLPAQRPANARRLPPPSSAARSAMSALGASERGFSSPETQETIEELQKAVESICPIYNMIKDGQPIKGTIVRGPYTEEKERAASPAK